MADPASKPVAASKPVPIDLGFSSKLKEGETGVFTVVTVAKWGSAAKAGLQPGDDLVQWNGQTMASPEQFLALLQSIGPGKAVKVTVRRAGKQFDVDIMLRKKLSLELEEVDEVLERKISP